MEIVTLIILILVLIALAILVWLSLNKKDGLKDKSLETSVNLLFQRLNEVDSNIGTKIGEGSKQMFDSVRTQFSESAKLIKDVTQGLTKLDETNRQVVSFADQLQSLQDILKNPKQRGILGEYYLKELLGNVFSPNQYQMQYKFADGQIVDAVIFIGNNVKIPIDSKFSLENYNKILEEKDLLKKEELEKLFRQDLKNRIDETSKYIRPNEGTSDFAFMFIPAEAIYYDLLVNKIGTIKTNTRDLIEYAVKDKHVHIVSPTSFYAYLQTIVQGFRAMKIEESTKEIRKNVENLGKHLKSFEEYQGKLGNALTTTVNHFNASNKEFKKIDKDVVRITGAESDIELLEVSKPELEE